MSLNSSINLQDVFLNHCRRERLAVEVQMTVGKARRGCIRGFDAQVLILDTDSGQCMIYKRSVQSINPVEAVDFIFNEQFKPFQRPVNMNPDYQDPFKPFQRSGHRNPDSNDQFKPFPRSEHQDSDYTLPN